MRSLFRPIGLAGALVTAAFVGGALVGAALAAPPAAPAVAPGVLTPPAVAPAPIAAPAVASGVVTPPAVAPAGPAAALDGSYCRTYRTAFAAELGVPESALAPAARTAAAATVDAAVAAGDLTVAQATRIKARIAAIDGDACTRLAARLADRLDDVARDRQP